MLSPSSGSRSVPLRRNGRRQACEPCRKRKLACDHELPACQRCRKKKQESECVYMPAPMTKRIISESEGVLRRPQVAAVSPDIVVKANGSPAEVQGRLPAISDQVRHVEVANERRHFRERQEHRSPPWHGRHGKHGQHRPPKALEHTPRSSTLFSTPSGYLGPTSFSSIFWENQQSLGPAGQGLQDLSDSVQASTTAEIGALLRFAPRTAHKVVSRIPTQHCSETLLELQSKWMNIGMSHCHKRLWEVHGNLLRTRRGEDLEKLAMTLHRNAMTPFREPEDTNAYLAAFTGENIRWEALGMLFINWAYGAMSSRIPESLFTSPDGHEKDRKQFLLEMRNSARFCVELCSETDMCNPLLVSLLYNFSLLTSIFSGDTSILLWRMHGDLACAATALGLHREPPISSQSPAPISLALEVRRRVHAGVFAIDKALASFTGRPPLMTRRYVTAVLPLDVSDEDLILSKEELGQIVASHDQNGWNTKGEIYPATRIRLHYLMSLIRDEILEWSLGTAFMGREAEMVAAILDLKQRSQAQYESFPWMVKYETGDEVGPISDLTVSCRISVRNRYLQNCFLIERLLQKAGYSEGQELLDIARESLAVVLISYNHRDRFVDQHHDFEWIIMCYGVPVAGVLCLELLKQSGGGPHNLKLPRSETIQNLSMFAAFLDWVRPGDGNYQLCQRMRTIIKKVLDQILEGPPANQATSTDPQAIYDFELPSDFPAWDDLGNINFLDTLDWVKAPWVGQDANY